jgi:hypothetical protein
VHEVLPNYALNCCACSSLQVFAYTGGPAPPWLDRNAWYVPVRVSPEHLEKMPVSSRPFKFPFNFTSELQLLLFLIVEMWAMICSLLYICIYLIHLWASMLQRIGLKKIVLKVAMCCPKCAEIVAEAIKEVGGKWQQLHTVTCLDFPSFDL